MRAIRLWAAALAMAMPAAAAEPRILVFGKVEAGQYVHEAIPTGARALMAMGPKEGFIADTTTDPLGSPRRAVRGRRDET